MTTLELVPEPASSDQSPFDAIKQTREDGSEFWSARDLMEPLGYAAWREFKVPIERAMKAANNQKMDVTSQFGVSPNLVERPQGGGNAREDFHLSRYAAYLVAMNGDPNKPKVALAQDYFARQTRFAEVVQENPALLAPSAEEARALSAGEVGTFYKRTLDAYSATITPATADSPTAHALAYSMQEFSRLMAFMIKDAASAARSIDKGDTDSIEGAPVFSIAGPSGSDAPYVSTPTGAASTGERLPDFRFMHEDETNELITWAAFAKSKGIPRCGRCGQGLSRRIMNAAVSCGTSRGRVNGHSVFTYPVWELAWGLYEKRYTERHNDPARNHAGGRA